MKFGKQIQKESVPEWRDQYVSYKKLKRILKKIDIQLSQLRKASVQTEFSNSLAISVTENSPLVPHLQNSKHRCVAEFEDALNSDIFKINNFYAEKEKEIQLLMKEWQMIYKNEAKSLSVSSGTEDSSIRYEHILTGHSELAKTVASRLLLVYREVEKLRSYSELNFTGVRKIVKKFDKTTGMNTHDIFLARLIQEPFYLKQSLNHLSEEIHQIYSKVSFTKLSLDESLTLLNENEHIQNEVKCVYKPSQILLALAAGLLFWYLPLFEPDQNRASRCLSLLSFVLTLWVTEAIPFFVSALCIPPLVVLFGLIADNDGIPFPPEAAAQYIFSKVFDHTFALVMGGFSISAAFSKYEFELVLASFIQIHFGQRPYLFLLAFMSLSWFLSMWISNVAAPVLCTAIILPIVRDFPLNCKFTKALLLGLAFSCNIGGMLSPISSPQNAFTVGYLSSAHPQYSISFFEWIQVSFPFCAVALLLLWGYIIMVIRPDDVDEISSIVWDKKPFSGQHYTVLFVTIFTATLWCSLSLTKPLFGDMGVIAYFPIIIYFGSGILTKTDLNDFQWNLLMLIGGGSCLGAAVSSSNLLQIITDSISPYLPNHSLWVTFVVVSTFVGFVTTFISHTVGAIVLVPMVAQIGVEISGSPVQILVMGCAFMCSAAMALPMSSFPNINSLFVEDDFERPYLKVKDYIRHGLPFSAILLVLCISWGYLIMYLTFIH